MICFRFAVVLLLLSSLMLLDANWMEPIGIHHLELFGSFLRLLWLSFDFLQTTLEYLPISEYSARRAGGMNVY